jgi:hypothetical protein
MKRAECKSAIHQLVYRWAKVNGVTVPSDDTQSYLMFKNWAIEEGFGNYFEFQSSLSSDFEIEIWFDEILEQSHAR